MQASGDEKVNIDVDAAICNFGFVSSLRPIKNWGLNIEKILLLLTAGLRQILLEFSLSGIFSHMMARLN
jgi:hypothetical protein